MSTGCPRANPSRTGFTLVELLLALVIAALLAGVLVALYHTATRTAGDLRLRAHGPHAVEATLDQLADELRRAILQAAGPEDLFFVEPASDTGAAGSSLGFCSREPASDGEPDRARAIRLSYRIGAEPATQEALLRIQQTLTGAGSLDPPLTNRAAQPVAGFAVEVFDGTAWHERWPPPKAQETARPRLVRVAITQPGSAADAAPHRIEVVLPAGQSVTSSLVRTGSTTDAR